MNVNLNLGLGPGPAHIFFIVHSSSKWKPLSGGVQHILLYTASVKGFQRCHGGVHHEPIESSSSRLGVTRDGW